MKIIVQKFGGSSLATTQLMQQAAQRIARAKISGVGVVVVVSAMGDDTDQLALCAKQIPGWQHSTREMDVLLSCGEQKSMALLAMSLQAIGVSAISLSAWQAGIRTREHAGQACIEDIDVSSILQHVQLGAVVIVAGFQGVSSENAITTLGRGGSDLTAVALASSLPAVECQIYTDVDGVYSADPRIVKNAKKLDRISYQEMLGLSSLGAKVLCQRAVVLAERVNLNLRVLSSFNYAKGTLVTRGQALHDVTGIVSIRHQTLIEVTMHEDAYYKCSVMLDEVSQSVRLFVVTGESPPKTFHIKIVTEQHQVIFFKKQLCKILKQDEFEWEEKINVALISVVGGKVYKNNKFGQQFQFCVKKSHSHLCLFVEKACALSAVVDADSVAVCVRRLHQAFCHSELRVLENIVTIK